MLGYVHVQEEANHSSLSLYSLQGRCLFAIPKKGRLYEKCLELLAG